MSDGKEERTAALTSEEVFQSEVLCLNTLTADAAKILTRMIGEDVELALSLEPRAPMVKGDRGRLFQVLMNLAVNARDAMPKGGTLAVETSLMAIGESSPAQPDANRGSTRCSRLTTPERGSLRMSASTSSNPSSPQKRKERHGSGVGHRLRHRETERGTRLALQRTEPAFRGDLRGKKRWEMTGRPSAS